MRRTVGVLLIVISSASFGAMAISARLAYAAGGALILSAVLLLARQRPAEEELESRV